MDVVWGDRENERKESREYQNLFFEQVERKRRTEQEQKLQNVGKQLDELEKELDVLVLCAELAR